MKKIEKGFTLVEVLAAALIFTAIALPLSTYILRTTSTGSKYIRNKQCAYFLAKKASEDIYYNYEVRDKEETFKMNNSVFTVVRKVTGDKLKKITISVNSGKRIYAKLYMEKYEVN